MSTEYTVQDNSILVPTLKRFVWVPVLKMIPERTSANTLTLLGTLLSAIAFAITVFVPATRFSCAVIAALIFCYLTLDNIDGAQARRTGTSSPLGEFLDHWLDSLNMAFLFVGCIYTWQIPADRAVIVMIFAVLSYTMTFWEQRVSGRIHMTWMGNVEGIVTVILFYLGGAIFGPDALINTKIFYNLTVIDFFWLSAILNTALTSVGPVERVGKRYFEVLEIVAPVAMTAIWYAFGKISALQVCTMMMLLAPALAGRVLIGRVTKRDELRPDPLLFVMVLLGCGASVAFDLSISVQRLLLNLVILYALGQVLLDFVLTVRRLGDYLRPGELLAFAIRLRG